MFTKKSKLRELEQRFNNVIRLTEERDEYIDELELSLANRTKESYDLGVELREAQERIDELEAGIAEKGDHTSATLHISDDLETVTPVTRVRPETITKLVEKKYLPYNKQDDDFAINLAAMLVAYEALEQIIYTFEESLRGNVEFDDGGSSDEEQ